MFGLKKKSDAQPEEQAADQPAVDLDNLLEIGTDVEYFTGKVWRKGKVHGISQAENGNGEATKITYLVDTGKIFRKAGFENIEDIPEQIETTHAIEQPQQVAVTPENIRAAE